MKKEKKRQRSDEVAADSGGGNMSSSQSPKAVDKIPNNNSDMNSNNTNFTPPSNDDPSTWSKSKRKRMRQKRNKAAKKLLLASGDNNSTPSSGEKHVNGNSSSHNIMNSPSKQTASAMQKMNMNSPNNSTKSNSTAHFNGSDEDFNSKKRHKKNPDIDKSQSKISADRSTDISDHTVSNEDHRSPKREEKQKNDTACSPTSNTQIDGEDTPTKKKRKKKKKKKSPVKEDTSSTSDTKNDTKNDTASSSSEPNSNIKPTNNKPTTNDTSTSNKKPASPKLKISLPKQSQMSTLQKSFLERLTSSRFRELNEELYTHSSQHSFNYFTANPELFDQYHVGFRKQVEDWPVNPVDVIYKKIVSSWRKDRVDKKNSDGQEEQQTVVADFGCGDAKLGERLLSLQIGKDGQSLTPSVSTKKKKKQNQQQQASICPFKVHSFDLVSGGNKLVTPADMANLPLEKECIDVGVYSLALMGTNVADFVREAWRVLKFNGVLRVAEVRSRFETAAAEDNDTNKHSGGGGKRGKLNNGKKSLLKKKNSKPIHSASGDDDNEYNTPQPIMLLDEFLALMERCGFDCTNMDRSNKMFLFMDFVKVDGSKGLSEKERFTAKPCIYKRR